MCPVYLVLALSPATLSISNCNLIYCLENSPVNSLIVTSIVLPISNSGSLANVSPISFSSNSNGVLIVYQLFSFHVSRACRLFAFAIL